MHFYRTLQPVRAITFDLDDTLYDNGPVIQKTSQAAHATLQSLHPSLSHFSLDDYTRVRHQLRLEEPEIYHDVSEWRRRTTMRVLTDAGLMGEEALAGTTKVMDEFTYWRSQITVSAGVHHILADLARSAPLVAVTNGNVDLHRCGIAKYFMTILRAGPDGRAKPWSDMYHRAAEYLGLPEKNILHVGDHLSADVAGALGAGMQACWFNPRGDNLRLQNSALLLPHLEISRLTSLISLV